MNADLKDTLRQFLIELLIYGVLVVIYFLLVLRFLNPVITRLFGENLLVYGIVGLLLILAQGVLLDAVTSFLLNQIKLDRLD